MFEVSIRTDRPRARRGAWLHTDVVEHHIFGTALQHRVQNLQNATGRARLCRGAIGPSGRANPLRGHANAHATSPGTNHNSNAEDHGALHPHASTTQCGGPARCVHGVRGAMPWMVRHTREQRVG